MDQSERAVLVNKNTDKLSTVESRHVKKINILRYVDSRYTDCLVSIYRLSTFIPHLKDPSFFASRAANIVAGNNVKLGIFWEKLKSNKRAKGKIC